VVGLIDCKDRYRVGKKWEERVYRSGSFVIIHCYFELTFVVLRVVHIIVV
jgi:hypothetical protein